MLFIDIFYKYIYNQTTKNAPLARFFYTWSSLILFCTGCGYTSNENTFPVLHLLPVHPGWLQKYAGGIIKSAHILFLPDHTAAPVIILHVHSLLISYLLWLFPCPIV